MRTMMRAGKGSRRKRAEQKENKNQTGDDGQ